VPGFCLTRKPLQTQNQECDADDDYRVEYVEDHGFIPLSLLDQVGSKKSVRSSQGLREENAEHQPRLTALQFACVSTYPQNMVSLPRGSISPAQKGAPGPRKGQKSTLIPQFDFTN
jgi:hypothetical protein